MVVVIFSKVSGTSISISINISITLRDFERAAALICTWYVLNNVGVVEMKTKIYCI